MALEIERKFLVIGDFEVDVFESVRIRQAYVSSAAGKTVRVRTRGDKAYLTIKGPSRQGGLTRFEWEKEISLEDAEQLLEIAEPGQIDKTRNLIRNTDGRHVWEVDVFHGDNEGLVIAEIELQGEDDTFDVPDWLGPEVTGLRQYYNSSLINHPYKSWE